MKKSVLLFILLCLVSFHSMQARADMEIKPYIGLNFVYDGMQFHDKFGNDVSDAVLGILDTSLETNFIQTKDLISNGYIGFNFNLGAQISNYLGVEGFFQKSYGYHHKTKDFVYETSYPWNQHDKIKVQELEMLNFGTDAIGCVPIVNSGFSILGSFGIGYYKFRMKATTTTYQFNRNNGSLNYSPRKYHESDEESNIGFRFGFGGQYAFSEKIAIRLMARFVEINSDKDEDVFDNMVDISMGLKYTF